MYTCFRHSDQTTRIVCQRCERPICPECMQPGAVGFHCPQCVQSGNRETRQGQLPYGGLRGADARLTSIILIVANAVIWLLVLATKNTREGVLDLLALTPLGICRSANPNYYYPDVTEAADCVANWVPGVASGAPWQVLTSGFTHEAIMHLAFNMFVLWMLGPQLERILGRARFLAVYFVSLLGGSAAVMLFAEPTSQTVGASGAIYGMLGAVLLLALKHKGNVTQIMIWLGINIAFTFMFPGISWQGHLGGLLGGLAVTAALVLLPRELRAKLQWPLVGAIAVGFVAVIVARALSLG